MSSDFTYSSAFKIPAILTDRSGSNAPDSTFNDSVVKTALSGMKTDRHEAFLKDDNGAERLKGLGFQLVTRGVGSRNQDEVVVIKESKASTLNQTIKKMINKGKDKDAICIALHLDVRHNPNDLTQFWSFISYLGLLFRQLSTLNQPVQDKIKIFLAIDGSADSPGQKINLTGGGSTRSQTESDQELSCTQSSTADNHRNLKALSITDLKNIYQDLGLSIEATMNMPGVLFTQNVKAGELLPQPKDDANPVRIVTDSEFLSRIINKLTSENKAVYLHKQNEEEPAATTQRRQEFMHNYLHRVATTI